MLCTIEIIIYNLGVSGHERNSFRSYLVCDLRISNLHTVILFIGDNFIKP